MSVAGLIAEIGEKYSVGKMQAICRAFGIAISAASMLPEDSAINIYLCRALEYRFASINDSEYAYTITYKFIEYSGYEDADLNSSERAYVAADTEFVEYVDGEDYYTDYSAQVDDAYEMFERIGQMD